MIGLSGAGHRAWASRLFGIGLIVTGLGFFDSRPAAASPIRSAQARHEAALLEKAHHSWSAYLLAGPSVWSSISQPCITPEEARTAIWRALRSDDEANPWVKYLLWKHNIN